MIDRKSFRDWMRSAPAAVPTGIGPLDELLDGGFTPGITTIGARMGNGKTSLVLQIADNMTNQGVDVLWFSLDMTMETLAAKSISREMYLRWLETGRGRWEPTINLIMHRERMPHVEMAAAEYFSSPGAGHFFMRDTPSEPRTASQVCREARAIALALGHAPVIVIDYLQELLPDDPARAGKAATDESMRRLRQLATELNTPVLVVTSFNRASYPTDISGMSDEEICNRIEAAGKESGSIEYGAGAVLGMIMTERDETARTATIGVWLPKNRWGGRKTRPVLLRLHTPTGTFTALETRELEEPEKSDVRGRPTASLREGRGRRRSD